MRLLVFSLVVLFAGCLAQAPDADPVESGDGADGTGQPVGGTDTRSQELGRDEVFTPGPGGHTFTVAVPEGGATNVRWTLTIEGPNITSTVNGHGCSSNVNVNLVIAVGATSTRSGSCDDLPAGPAEFTVSLTDPAVSYTAIIHGTVMVSL